MRGYLYTSVRPVDLFTNGCVIIIYFRLLRFSWWVQQAFLRVGNWDISDFWKNRSLRSFRLGCRNFRLGDSARNLMTERRRLFQSVSKQDGRKEDYTLKVILIYMCHLVSCFFLLKGIWFHYFSLLMWKGFICDLPSKEYLNYSFSYLSCIIAKMLATLSI